jgi:hypothetical protein
MLDSLKAALEQKIGFKIETEKACRKLEKTLLDEGIYLSDTTLTRIFSMAFNSKNALENYKKILGIKIKL